MEVTTDKAIQDIARFEEVTSLTDLKYCVPQNEIADALDVSTAYVSQLVRQLNVKVFKYRKFSYLPSSSVRAIFSAKGYKYPERGKIIAVQMLKGGAAKTATATNLALRLVHFGAKVCLLDMDSQGNASSFFRVPRKGIKTFTDVISGKTTLSSALVNVSENLAVLPSNFDNAAMDLVMFTKQKNPATFVATQIEELRNQFDFIILDCNPSLSMFNASITLAADEVILPVNPDESSIESLGNVTKEFGTLEKENRKQIPYKILLAKFDLRTTTARDYLLKFSNAESDKIYSSVIRFSNDYATSLATQTPIFMMKKSGLKEDYDRFTREIMGLKVKDTNATQTGNA